MASTDFALTHMLESDVLSTRVCRCMFSLLPLAFSTASKLAVSSLLWPFFGSTSSLACSLASSYQLSGQLARCCVVLLLPFLVVSELLRAILFFLCCCVLGRSCRLSFHSLTAVCVCACNFWRCASACAHFSLTLDDASPPRPQVVLAASTLSVASWIHNFTSSWRTFLVTMLV